MIIDVKSPFPQTGSTAKVDFANQIKYGHLRMQYKKKLGRATVSTQASIGPVLGLIPPSF